MRKAVTALAVAAAFVSLTSVRAQDSKTTLDAAAKALGDVSSIQFSGHRHDELIWPVVQTGRAVAPVQDDELHRDG